mmetsp:Transcript_22381/g.27345  ORF Transcript_22381/g.27345 Transcript_22381/m.27345 type:complete len:335 (-) Transcript_22381:469-1473(-)|eukprot:CAMPEP_0194368580 /NCGR_PEP_ID=MMETSP0174-20130528/16783_1 /TAXON_ID=216777 /ORGANISM="Proboscia alata, Strain PI-D3" /LENGTH=334 /DNA_ID=CAMNT_0039144993 /DNA_START=147 /DNA_END=1151 /DNA_ORIENTATION=+
MQRNNFRDDKITPPDSMPPRNSIHHRNDRHSDRYNRQPSANNHHYNNDRKRRIDFNRNHNNNNSSNNNNSRSHHNGNSSGRSPPRRTPTKRDSSSCTPPPTPPDGSLTSLLTQPPQATQAHNKRLKPNPSSTFPTTTLKNKPLLLDGVEIPPLDASKPEHARRIQQRRRMILFGKNTVGYDEYLQKVPKEKRRRCPEHPQTPDYTKDIPTRRFQGLVKAWRKGLHMYDPPELQEQQKQQEKEKKAQQDEAVRKENAKKAAASTDCVKGSQIADAIREGLPVVFNDSTAVPSVEEDEEDMEYESADEMNIKQPQIGTSPIGAELMFESDDDDDLL